jgi:hypothetical protein
LPNSPPFVPRGREPLFPCGGIMIWHVPGLLKDIFLLGRRFPWPRPECCWRCRSPRLWGHGFVRRYIDGFPDALLLKCFRCPDCGCVVTLRPESHFPRIRSSKQTIRSHLLHRLTRGCWPPSKLCRPRMRHWLSNLKRRVEAYLTHAWSGGLWAGFDELLRRGQIPVARLS